ncbi:MAG: shikimate kinase [Bacteroidia bacterium]
MSTHPPVFLTGYMGAGKTTIGRLLAKETDAAFIDLDDLIEERNNLAIPVIFELYGEDHFRNLEREALHSLKDKENLIVATGGGCPSFFDNIEWMNRHGITVYLRCHPGKIFHRIAPEKQKRPLIAGMDDVDIMEFILESIKKRLPFYVQSRITVNADNEPDQVLHELLQKLDVSATSFSQD